MTGPESSEGRKGYRSRLRDLKKRRPSQRAAPTSLLRVMGKRNKGKRHFGGAATSHLGGAKSATELFREGFDVSKKAKAAAQSAVASAAAVQQGGVSKKKRNKKKKDRAVPFYTSAAAGKRGSRKGGRKGGSSGQHADVDKAIRKAAQSGNVNMILACTLLPNALAVESKTTGVVIELLVKHARLREASALLRALQAKGNPPLPFALVTAALLALPQTIPAEVSDSVELVASAVSGRSSFFQDNATLVVSEFVCEYGAALDALRSQPLGSLVRSGRACVVVRVVPGMKPGEISCERDSASAEVDRERRGLQAGDCVAVSFVGRGHGGGDSFGGIGRYAGGDNVDGGDDGDDDGGRDALYEAEVAVGMPLVLRLASADDASRLVRRGGPLRIDKLANRVAYKRQLAAVTTVIEACDRARSALGGGAVAVGGAHAPPPPSTKQDLQRPSAGLAAAICARANGAPRVAVETLCGSLVSPGAQAMVRSRQLPCFGRLNRSQEAACAAAAGNAVTLVQGPPGTGKTATALAILQAWVRSGCLRGGAALATSDSNIAVDNLLEGLARAGVRVVRLGRPDSVRPELLRFCPDAGGASSGDKAADYAAKLAAIRSAEVVCATCVGVGAELLKACSFPAVLVDEATQATEATTLVALCRGAQQLCLLGDQCQLPPTLVSRHPAAMAASAPLFTRLLADGAPRYLLDTQYRMHPAIAQLPADLVYAGGLQTGVEPAERRPVPGFPWPRADWPVALIPVYAGGGESGDGSSKLNRAEAEETVLVVQALQRAGLGAAEIGVISPYAAQVRLLRSLLRAGRPRGSGGHGGYGGGGGGPPDGRHVSTFHSAEAAVEVSSVDGFQGREKEVIVFSCVRSNAGGALGFLSDARRLNVAFTRARRGLIVLGHPPTLGKDGSGPWAHWLRWARAQGLVLGEAPCGEYDREATRRASAPLMAGYEPAPSADAAVASARSTAVAAMASWQVLSEAHKAAQEGSERAGSSRRVVRSSAPSRAGRAEPAERAYDPVGGGHWAGGDGSREQAYARGRDDSHVGARGGERRGNERRDGERRGGDSRDRRSGSPERPGRHGGRCEGRRRGGRNESRSSSSSSSSSYSRSWSSCRSRSDSRSPSCSPDRQASRRQRSPRVDSRSPDRSMAATASSAHAAPSAHAAEWTAVKTAEGEEYYWNQATGETTWETPV